MRRLCERDEEGQVEKLRLDMIRAKSGAAACHRPNFSRGRGEVDFR